MAHPSVISIISKIKIPFSVNSVAQIAAEAALKEKKFKFDLLELIRSERERMISAFQKRGIKVQPTEANFLMVQVDFDGDELFKRLLSEGIIIRPGSFFGIQSTFRFSIGNREENTTFLEKFDKVRESISQ